METLRHLSFQNLNERELQASMDVKFLYPYDSTTAIVIRLRAAVSIADNAAKRSQDSIFWFRLLMRLN